MLLELALSTLLPISLDPCDFVQEHGSVTLAPIQSCTSVQSPSFNLGESSFSRFKVEIDPDIDGVAITNAAIFAQVDPQPSADVYQLGAWPVCEINGTLVDAGTGAFTRWWENDGWATNFDPYGGGTPLAIGLNKESCLSPNTRAVVVYGGYTTEIPSENPGWEGGDNSIGGWTFNVNESGWGDPSPYTNQTYTVSQSVCSGTYQSCYSTLNGYSFEFGVISATGTMTPSIYRNGSGTITSECGGDWSCQTATTQTKVLNYGVTGSENKGFYVRRYDPQNSNATLDLITWWPETADNREGAGYPWTVAAYLLTSSELDKVLYDPTFDGTGFLWPEGQCDTWQCVTEFCSGTGWDLVGWFQCLFNPGVTPDEMVRSMFDSISNWGWWQAVDYGRLMALSTDGRFVALTGECRDYGFEGGGLFSGFSVSTCDLPMEDSIRFLLGAVIYVMTAFVLVSWGVTFLESGGIPNPFKRPEEEK